MTNKITLREFQNKDRKGLTKIIKETWQYDQFCSSRTAFNLAQVYLNSCLTNQTYTRVALIDDIPVGIIMAKNVKKHHCPLKYKLRQFVSIASLYLKKEGRQVSQIFASVEHIDQDLYKEVNKDYLGEVAFFVVDANYRGQGIGKKLFTSLQTYMEKEKINEFYLFTDTSCHYQFYEHQGMKRLAQKQQSFTIKSYQASMTFFLYEYQQ